MNGRPCRQMRVPTERETSVLDVPDDGDSDSEKEWSS